MPNEAMAVTGAMATMHCVKLLCGEKFFESLARETERLNTEDRLTFWNLLNVSMNSNPETWVCYGKNWMNPYMIGAVALTAQEIVKRMAKNKKQKH